MRVAEVERLLVRIMGDNRNYINALQGAQRQTLYFTQTANGQFRDFQGRFISTQEAIRRNLALTHMRIGEITNRMGNLGRVLRASSENFKAFGRNMSIYVTAPIAALAGITVKAAGDFDQSFAGIRKTVNASNEEFDRLSMGLRGLAKDIPVSIHTLNEIGAMAGRLGIDTGNIQEFTRVTAGLSVSTNLGAEEAATELARFMNIMETSQTDIERLASSLINLGNNFATTERWILDFAVRTAGAAKIAGLTEAEVLGLSTALSSVGIEAEAGGTAVQKMLLKITQAVATGSEDLAKFAEAAGTSAKGFAQMWESDPARALTRFFQGLRDQGTGAIAILQELEVADARSIRAMLSLAGSANVLTDAFDKANEGWKANMAFTKETQTFYNTLWGTLGKLKNRLVDVSITLGTALIPVIKDLGVLLEGLIRYLESWAEWFARLTPAMKDLVVVTAALAAALGPVTFLVGMFLNSGAAIIRVVVAIVAQVRYLAITITLLQASLAGVATVAVIAGLYLLAQYFGLIGNGADKTLASIERLEEKLANSKFNKATTAAGGYVDFLRTQDIKKVQSDFDSIQAKMASVRKQMSAVIDSWWGDPKNSAAQYVELSRTLDALDRMAAQVALVLEEKQGLENLLADIKMPAQEVLDFIDKLTGDIDTFWLEGVDKEVADFYSKMKKEGIEVGKEQRKQIDALAQEFSRLEMDKQAEEDAKSMLEKYMTPFEKLQDELTRIDWLVEAGAMSDRLGADMALRAIKGFEGDKKRDSKQAVVVSAGEGQLQGNKQQLLDARAGEVYQEKDSAKRTAKNTEELTEIQQAALEEAREFYIEALARLSPPPPPVGF